LTQQSTTQAGSTVQLNPWLNLSGLICAVTGGASGIGAETVRQLAELGASVAILDRNTDAGEKLANSLLQKKQSVMFVETDVASLTSLQNAADKINLHMGPCNALVNSAALVGYAGPLLDADLELWDRMLSVNLTGALRASQVFAKQMIAAGKSGSIVNVASVCGHVPLPNGGAYSVGKSGLMMMSRLLTLELAPYKIRCNSVSPGLVHTEATDAVYKIPEIYEKREKLVPAGRIASPSDLANVIVFLLSERSSYISGQDLLVDGAFTQTMMGFVPKPQTSLRLS
jgi:NAD(P)-dependent dehydrogenase (short-subunit alcohol dehydrogenase family)